jgi:thioredoxin reductase/ferredoxin
MFSLVARYARWLHTGHPAGAVEPFPEIREDGSTAVDGLWVAGDLTGVPLLKHAVDSGARVVDRIAGRGGDLVIVGAGVAGMSAALQARRLGLDFRVVETREPFATIADFPKAKPIFTYPAEMEPAGTLRITANVKESLLDELRQQASPIETVSGTARQVVRESAGLRVELEDGSSLSARNVLVAIGRSGEYRALGVEGENGEQVHRRLHDPHAFTGSDVVVIGGGDTAVESAVALADAGAHVTLAHRGNQLKRPKPENLRRLQQGPVRVLTGAQTRSIGSDRVEFDIQGDRHSVPASTTFVLIGRTPPLGFFRRSGVPIRGEGNVKRWLSLVVLLAIAFFVYHWKSDSGPGIYARFSERGWFPFGIADPASPATLGGTLRISMQTPAFWYSLAYSLAVTVFGVLRIRRRNTPYITRQTLTLMVIQVVPLFLLPFVILPWLGHNGFFDTGWRLWLADELFPATEWDPQGREYWRSVGFILAWPLMIWNVFSDQALKLWLAISLVQTFVLIPLMVRRWGKGAYCGWICSCGALAETLGDRVRDRMPHGPGWNRLNLLGQGVLVLAFLLLALRVASWSLPDASWSRQAYMAGLMGRGADWSDLGGIASFLNYAWSVDLLLAGILGVGLYAHFSGRTWCRFGCPLAALMNLYAKLGTQFRIFADAKRCISCNLCTTNCHQGIDVMHFAQQGEPMDDPQCVRCSACVQTCPTVALEFGRIDPSTGSEIARDRWRASATPEDA